MLVPLLFMELKSWGKYWMYFTQSTWHEDEGLTHTHTLTQIHLKTAAHTLTHILMLLRRCWTFILFNPSTIKSTVHIIEMCWPWWYLNTHFYQTRIMSLEGKQTNVLFHYFDNFVQNIKINTWYHSLSRLYFNHACVIVWLNVFALHLNPSIYLMEKTTCNQLGKFVFVFVVMSLCDPPNIEPMWSQAASSTHTHTHTHTPTHTHSHARARECQLVSSAGVVQPVSRQLLRGDRQRTFWVALL